MFLKLAYLPSKLRISGKYLFQEHQISSGQLSADSSLTETLHCLNSSITVYSMMTSIEFYFSLCHEVNMQPAICFSIDLTLGN